MLTRDFPSPAERNWGALPPPGFLFTFPVPSRRIRRSRVPRGAGSFPGCCYKRQPWTFPFGSGSVRPQGGCGVSPTGKVMFGGLGACRLHPRTSEGREGGNQRRRSRQRPLSSAEAQLQTDSKQPSLEAEAAEAGREEPRPPSSLRQEHEQPGGPASPSRFLKEASPGSRPSAPRSGFGRLQALRSPCHERERGARKAGAARRRPWAEEVARRKGEALRAALLPSPSTHALPWHLGLPRSSAAEHGLKSSLSTAGRPASPRLSWAAGARG